MKTYRKIILMFLLVLLTNLSFSQSLLFKEEDFGEVTTLNRLDNGEFIISMGSFRIIKTDPSGNILWEKIFNHHSASDSPNSIYVDDEYIIAISNYYIENKSKVSLHKLNFDGEEIWNKNYEPGDIEIGISILPAVDTGYIVMSYHRYGNTYDQAGVTLRKVDMNGNLDWKKEYNYSGVLAANPQRFFRILQLGASSYLIKSRKKLTKIDSVGEVSWIQNFGNDISLFDTFNDYITISLDNKIMKLNSDHELISELSFSSWDDNTCISMINGIIKYSQFSSL